MNNISFWNSLKTNWSSLQVQAKNTKFDSELLSEMMNKQIQSAKKIRQTHYRNDDYLAFVFDDDDDF